MNTKPKFTVTCVKRNEKGKAIELRGLFGSLTRKAVIELIDKEAVEFETKVGDKSATISTVPEKKGEYLRTDKNQTKEDNLSSLPDWDEIQFSKTNAGIDDLLS